MAVSESDYKQALGRFASGVTVVSMETEGEAIGMTASAFLSVSLDPPLVLVSIAKSARMHGLLPVGQRFGIVILAKDQAAVSALFAGYEEGGTAWDTLDGVPVVAGGVAALACTMHAAHDAGDHSLFVARVDATSVAERDPLLYFRGAYRAVLPTP